MALAGLWETRYGEPEFLTWRAPSHSSDSHGVADFALELIAKIFDRRAVRGRGRRRIVPRRGTLRLRHIVVSRRGGGRGGRGIIGDAASDHRGEPEKAEPEQQRRRHSPGRRPSWARRREPAHPICLPGVSIWTAVPWVNVDTCMLFLHCSALREKGMVARK